MPSTSPLLASLIATVLLIAAIPSYAQCGGRVPLLCDADGDYNVDQNDLLLIKSALGDTAAPGDVRDIDADGVITRQDANQCLARCSADSCASTASIYSVANSCVAISPDGGNSFLTGVGALTAGAAVSLPDPSLVDGVYGPVATSTNEASRFVLRPTDLGKYLLFDESASYMTSNGEILLRQTGLASDTRLVGDEVVIDSDMQSEGEWQLLAVADDRYRLKHLRSGKFVGADGNVVGKGDAADLEFVTLEGCATFPELTVDASGDITMTEFEDGSVYGFVETHAHLFTNLAFGGGGTFHGSPFHPLGVQHALADCDLVHGEGGRRDVMGAGFSGGGSIEELLPALINGELPDKQHDTEGYPEFTEWPAAPFSSTHQMQYYKWIERAYLSGLRLMVQHATTNSFLCDMVTGIGAQPRRHDCNDMVNVDKIIDATYALERYVDALAGGPGLGWFRIAYSPEEAREFIRDGKLAVVLGIETSALFDCFLVPFGDFEPCTEADVVAKLDEYYNKGVRVLFPVHKYDNAFSAGDGQRGLIQIGNFGHTGHYSSYIQCPSELLTFPGGFDNGGVPFANLNQPREIYDSPPPFDMSGLPDNVVGTLLPLINLLGGGDLAGQYCQKHGLTPLGEFLIVEMMKRGMILEVDHLPRKSYARAFELLVTHDYPAMGTHGRNYNGLLYLLGGMSKSNLGRCRNPNVPATMDDSFQARIQLMRDKGAFPAEGFGFDLNGFAGAPGPRFGPRSGCRNQTDEGITYPFTSYAGDITLEEPVVGNRTLDFNTEGMVHLGLVAELIEDVRLDGVTDEELEPLFKSAEGYLRVWEKSEARSQALWPRDTVN